jgi:hypothetical protein
VSKLLALQVPCRVAEREATPLGAEVATVGSPASETIVHFCR